MGHLEDPTLDIALIYYQIGSSKTFTMGFLLKKILSLELQPKPNAMKRLTYLTLALVFLIGTVITFDACKKEESEEPVTPTIPGLNEYTLNENVVVLDSTIVPTIEGNKYTFNFSNDPPEIKVGDILIGYSNGGFLKKVLSIEKSEKSTDFLLTLILGQALFNQVFKDCNFDINVPVISSEKSLDDKVLFNEQVGNVDLDVIIQEGSISTDLIMNFKLIRVDGETLLFGLSADGAIDFNSETEFSATGVINHGDEIDILPPITFPFLIGPVPAQFFLGFYGGFDASIHAEGIINYSCEASADMEFGAEYIVSDGWETTWVRDGNFISTGFDWNLTFGATTEVYIKPEIKLLVCGLLGPVMNAQPYLNFETNVNYPEWTWTLNGGMRGNLGFELNILGFLEIVDLNVPLAEWNRIVASNQGTISGETFTDPRDGQTYEIKEIGDQIWFAENLNYETDNSWWYDNNSANGDVYGRLYLWDEALNACPNGWHLPSDDEWKTLEMHLGMSQNEADAVSWRGDDEGKKLKSTSGWYLDGNGTDEVGFMALPGGFRNTNGNFITLGNNGYWFTATEYSPAIAWVRYLVYGEARIGRYDGNEGACFSVRCVRD